MNILETIDSVLEATRKQFENDIEKEINKGRSQAQIWNHIKRMYSNINMKKFEKVYNKLVSESTVTGDVATNKAKGSVDVIGMRYKKKKKRSKLTGAPIVVHEKLDEAMKEWNYMFQGVTNTMTIKAKDKDSAIKKIVKEWGIGSKTSNLFVWEA